MTDCKSCNVVKKLIQIIANNEDSCAHCIHAKTDIDCDENSFYYCDNINCDFTLKNT